MFGCRSLSRPLQNQFLSPEFIVFIISFLVAFKQYHNFENTYMMKISKLDEIPGVDFWVEAQIVHFT